MFREALGRDIKRVLVIGAGGGGDVLAAYHTCLVLRDEGISYIIGALPWERLSIDPTPGPIPVDTLREPVQVRSSIALVSAKTYAIKGGRVVKPQICNLLTYTGGVGLVYDAYSPVDKIASEISEFCHENGVDLIIGVDAGGDILTTGREETVLSPLADTYTLAVLKKLRDRGHLVLVGIYGPGCDGELPRQEVLRRLSICAERGHFLFFISIAPHHAAELERAGSYVHTEASRIPLLAYRGYCGKIKIRRQLKEVEVDLTVAGTYYITIEGACIWNILTRHIENSESVIQARDILNKLGILTELDIEEEICKIGVDKITPDLFMQIIAKIRERLCRASSSNATNKLNQDKHKYHEHQDVEG